ncbi:hypothetical protein SAMN05216588_113142 [Pseudomonas flavescens]|uniref:Uncharacterized protein n=1 Tax=Phytopseudomonas flavescens TaxID=29435 RepID=A0A1G8J1E1_9GAMM|nr:hypothetical protein [Pseudomonas flavescens]SDI24873.1 hypothetical protein SAMN05216588_113142 [Pseudomonas flavescens]
MIIAGALSSPPLVHLDQANESDANLLARLGEQHDAIAAVKVGRLLFMPTGASATASGPAILTLADGNQHRFLQSERNACSGVRA